MTVANEQREFLIDSVEALVERFVDECKSQNVTPTFYWSGYVTHEETSKIFGIFPRTKSVETLTEYAGWTMPNGTWGDVEVISVLENGWLCYPQDYIRFGPFGTNRGIVTKIECKEVSEMGTLDLQTIAEAMTMYFS